MSLVVGVLGCVVWAPGSVLGGPGGVVPVVGGEIPVASFAAASSKPTFLEADQVLRDAALIAEVELLEVEAGAWLGEGGELGEVKLKVSSDPRRILRGLEFVGRELSLRPPSGGSLDCTTALARCQEAGQTRLWIVLPAKAGGAWLTMRVIETRQGPCFEWRGYRDDNAVCVFTNSGELGPKRMADVEPFTVETALLVEFLRETRARELLGVARALIADEDDADLRRAARAVRAAGTRAEALSLLAAWPHLDAAIRWTADRHLRVLARRADPDGAPARTAARAEVLRWWQERVRRP